MSFIKLCEELTVQIQTSYETGITVEEAEKLAGKFLYAQIQVAEELRKADLDARMKKSGTKAIKASVYLEAATKTDKKPSDVMLGAMVDTNELVLGEQQKLDEAEVLKASLDNYMSIFQNAHIHFRTISKGGFSA
jgi:hypothetical protein